MNVYQKSLSMFPLAVLLLSVGCLENKAPFTEGDSSTPVHAKEPVSATGSPLLQESLSPALPFPTIEESALAEQLPSSEQTKELEVAPTTQPLATAQSLMTSQQPQPLQQDELPSLVVQSGKTDIPVVQSSYCWGSLGCADYVATPAMLRDHKLPTVSPGATIDIMFPYTPLPSEIQLHSLGTTASDHAVISLQNGTFHAPTNLGTYYYTFQAGWTSEDGMYSMGDTSFVFGFQVE
ncbi:hypothetical protein [Paenibacillus kandeliae]|uniref:hypothetical protein n=1 Tax=Paenibacillus kandeliae TaxID=3231269 RepID=UPI00345893C3